jgi:hypothetical protein
MTKQSEMTKTVCACAFGSLLAFIMVPAAAARADTTDSDFTQYLDTHGVHLGTPAQTVKMARVMCDDLNAGYRESDEVKVLTDSHRVNQSQAELFVGAATAEYCPDKHPANKPT